MKIFQRLKDRLDAGNAFGMLTDSWKQAETALSAPVVPIKSSTRINNILVCGMGGSAIAADVIKDIYRDALRVPLTVNRNYTLPAWVDSGTLVVISSYSGNTEETLAAMRSALELKVPVTVLTCGGAIQALARERGLSVDALYPGVPPRFAFYSALFTLIRILAVNGLLSDQDEFIRNSMVLLQKKADEYGSFISKARLMAVQIAGKIPVIYTVEGITSAAGLRFKGQLNENGKMHAFTNALPEMNHNEIVGWESEHVEMKRLIPFFIEDQDAHERVRMRIERSIEILNRARIESVRINSEEGSYPLRVIDIIYFCDWISYYTALLRKRDPLEIDNIDEIKKFLS